MTGIFLSLLIFAIAAWIIHRRFIRPLDRIREDLKRLSEGNFRLSMGEPEAPTYRSTASHIRSIAERLRTLDEQTVEGGLSLRGILSGMKEGILIANREKKITLVNDSLQSFFPDSKAEKGRSILEVLRRHEIEQAVTSTLDDGVKRDLSLVFEIPQPAGPVIQKHFDIHISPMSREAASAPQGVLLVFQDVTAIRTLEAARRDFVANVSHEFRTPLTVISGYVETLQDGATEDPEMTAVSLQAIHRHVQRLFLLLEDLLTISSMEGKGRRLQFSRVDLHRLAQRVIQNLQESGATENAAFTLNWAGDATFADVDENRIEQVYWNLLTNAIRHGESTSPQIQIHAALNDGNIEISVADNGAGIPFEDQAHIFERFYRVHKHRSRDAGGTGLGLSIVKNIVLAHGGRISLRSTPGRGATFIVRLPVTQNESRLAKE